MYRPSVPESQRTPYAFNATRDITGTHNLARRDANAREFDLIDHQRKLAGRIGRKRKINFVTQNLAPRHLQSCRHEPGHTHRNHRRIVGAPIRHDAQSVAGIWLVLL